MRRIAAICMLCFMLSAALVLPAHADEQIVLGLSQNEVSITATFQGSEIFVFGAVKRDAPPPDSGPLEVIIAVSGPLLPALVRMKERRLGIWVNTQASEIDAAPSFYAVSTSAPLEDILSSTEDLRYAISLPRVIRGIDTGVTDVGPFTEALVRLRTDDDLYQLNESAVNFEQQTLFRTAFTLPSNLIEGEYTARIFLTRNGAVVDELTTLIAVNKVGIERWLFNLAHVAPAAYGILSLLIAVAAGWLASAVFSHQRR